MADLKISQLTAISVLTPATDVLPVVDVGGVTKKIQVNQILASNGVAALASATITGDLTAARLIVTGGTIPTNGLWLATTNTLEFAANSLAQYRIAPLGVFSWYDGAGGTRMTLNSTGLGVGISPLYKFHAAVTSGAVGAFRATTAAIARLIVGNTVEDVELKVNANGDGQLTANASKYLGLGSGGLNDRVILDASGNVGIGVTTPSYKLDTYTTLQGAVTAKQFANRTANKILVKRFFGITADTALFSVECGTAGAGAMAAFEINVFATGQKSGSSGDRQFYGKWYVTRNLAGTFTITSAFSSGTSGAFTVTASGTSLNVNGIFSVISDGSACVEITGYIGGRDTVVETALNVTMP